VAERPGVGSLSHPKIAQRLVAKGFMIVDLLLERTHISHIIAVFIEQQEGVRSGHAPISISEAAFQKRLTQL
jgi:hypothetical protein